MADHQRNAHLSGVVHVPGRSTRNCTTLSNQLAQRPGSAVTVGVAAYISSLPNGARVSISALCDHFTEGEVRIARALRELESEGFLERRVERGEDGRLHTRTLVHDLPHEETADGDGPPEPEPGAAALPRGGDDPGPRRAVAVSVPLPGGTRVPGPRRRGPGRTKPGQGAAAPLVLVSSARTHVAAVRAAVASYPGPESRAA